MMDMAIRAPYGANASAASLIVIIYYAAHSLQRDIQIEGSQKNYPNFLFIMKKLFLIQKQKVSNLILPARSVCFQLLETIRDGIT